MGIQVTDRPRKRQASNKNGWQAKADKAAAVAEARRLTHQEKTNVAVTCHFCGAKTSSPKVITFPAKGYPWKVTKTGMGCEACQVVKALVPVLWLKARIVVRQQTAEQKPAPVGATAVEPELTFPMTLGVVTITKACLKVSHSSMNKALWLKVEIFGNAGKQKNEYPFVKHIKGDQVEISTGGATKCTISLEEWLGFVDSLPVVIASYSHNTVKMSPELVKMARDVFAGRRKLPSDKEWKAETAAASKVDTKSATSNGRAPDRRTRVLKLRMGLQLPSGPVICIATVPETAPAATQQNPAVEAETLPTGGYYRTIADLKGIKQALARYAEDHDDARPARIFIPMGMIASKLQRDNVLGIPVQEHVRVKPGNVWLGNGEPEVQVNRREDGYLLWLDRRVETDPQAAIERVASYFKEKTGKVASVVLLNPQDWPGEPTRFGDIAVRSEKNVLRHHLMIGAEAGS